MNMHLPQSYSSTVKRKQTHNADCRLGPWTLVVGWTIIAAVTLGSFSRWFQSYNDFPYVIKSCILKKEFIWHSLHGIQKHHTCPHQRQAVESFHKKERTREWMIQGQSCQDWMNVAEGQRCKDCWFLNMRKAGSRLLWERISFLTRNTGLHFRCFVHGEHKSVMFCLRSGIWTAMEVDIFLEFFRSTWSPSGPRLKIWRKMWTTWYKN